MDRGELTAMIRRFPDKPGVYLMHDKEGKTIYIGKAKSLRKRVSSYFRHSNFASPRLRKLVSEITDISTIRTESEAEALILEAKMIKLYQPFFNVDLKMGERYPFIRVTQERFPRLLVTRHKSEDGSLYFGPFVRVSDLRALLRLIEKYLPLRTCSMPLEKTPARDRPCMRYALGRCLAPCTEQCTEAEYRERAADIIMLLQGRGADVVERLHKKMNKAASAMEFEDAAKIRDTIRAIWRVSRQRLSSPSMPETDTASWQPIVKLQELLGLPSPPWRIDGFDISHNQGADTVGVVVVFEQGYANPSLYRRFNIRDVEGVDDFRSMRETLLRRYKRSIEGDDPMPQLILIDGGPVQLEFAVSALAELGLDGIPAVALAKREEEIYLRDRAKPLRLDLDDPALQLLMRVRDESHRFAITSHRRKSIKKFGKSALEGLPGIGKSRAAMLLTRFGSIKKIESLDAAELASVPGIGPVLARRILSFLEDKTEDIAAGTENTRILHENGPEFRDERHGECEPEPEDRVCNR